jgi:hypothetical protein
MTSEKLAAHTENRTYYFYIVNRKDNELVITMYNTNYMLIKDGDGWKNAPGNYFSMAQHLIEAVIAAVIANSAGKNVAGA